MTKQYQQKSFEHKKDLMIKRLCIKYYNILMKEEYTDEPHICIINTLHNIINHSHTIKYYSNSFDVINNDYSLSFMLNKVDYQYILEIMDNNKSQLIYIDINKRELNRIYKIIGNTPAFGISI